MIKKLSHIFTSIQQRLPNSPSVDSAFKTFSSQQIFNKVYRQKLWGKNNQGTGSSGPGSHTPHMFMPYVSAVQKVLARFQTPPSMVDLGCGDFNVGRHFAADVSELIACDVSDIILAQNALSHTAQNIRFFAA